SKYSIWRGWGWAWRFEHCAEPDQNCQQVFEIMRDAERASIQLGNMTFESRRIITQFFDQP
ncbi:MAG: hypothetical protein JXA33_04295, partial [Anaerolineae bacterium]|nr:hypothetical protein [Anaerolineae bacterium]